MKITAIEKSKGRLYSVFVDDAYWNTLDVELIVDSHLQTGMECSEPFLEELRRAAAVRRAKERAMYLLEYRDHSRKELVDKLCKSVDREIAEQTADKMEELGFLNDERYAQKLARDLLERKKLGERRAAFEMQKKGIGRDLAAQVIEEAQTDPEEQIQELVRRKYARYLTDEKGKRKVVGALMRLGHSYENIKRVLEQYTNEENNSWE